MQARSTVEMFPGEPGFAGDPDAPLGRKRLSAEDLFVHQCTFRNLPAFESQFYFAKSIGRRWKFDVAFPEFKVAVEIEGLVVRRINGQLVAGGRHATVTGFREDCIKYASAALLGWQVLRFEQGMVKSKYAVDTTIRLLVSRGWRKPD